MKDATIRALSSWGSLAHLKLDGGAARAIIGVWLRHEFGAQEDKWGKFHVGEHRWDLGRSVARKQGRYSNGGWFNVKSYDLIGLAAVILKNAGIEAGGEILEKRKTAKESAKTKREEKARQDAAQMLANKDIAFKHRDETLAWLQGHDIGDARHEALRAESLALKEQYLAGGPSDDAFASLDAPPVLPIYRSVDYNWSVEQDGVRYSVRVEHADGKIANIHIGKASEWMSVDPSRHSITMWTGPELQGDGSADGTIRDRDGVLVGSLFMVAAKKPRSGAGTRMLKIWCRMMAGYGVEKWIGEAVGEEGMAFLEGLERKGAIRIEAREGSYVGVRCL